ncbi:MAG: ATP-binding protein [Chloroflexota bacterium]
MIIHDTFTRIESKVKYINIVMYRGTEQAATQQNRFLKNSSLWVKIILPYLLLTMLIGGSGTLVFINLFTSSLQDRINNQLIDAGIIVSEGIVALEEERLQTLRTVSATEGVAEAVINGDFQGLSGLVPQILINDGMETADIVGLDGIAVYSWHEPASPQEQAVELTGVNWANHPIVSQVLQGQIDEQGDKFSFLIEGENGIVVYTVGPIKVEDEVVGAVLIGTQLRSMTFNLTLNAVARVTFYDLEGNVLETSLVGGQDEFIDVVNETDDFVSQVVRELESEPIVLSNIESETSYRNVEVLGQSYQLAFGEWNLRGERFGIFSVGVPRNPVETALQNGRNLFVAIFSIATAGVFLGGFLIAARITNPMRQLVRTAKAVSDGNLSRRSGIDGDDELGQLAKAFDNMTNTLAQRNQTLLEEASKLEAIVDSIADGVIVIDENNNIVTMNPAALALLDDMSYDFFLGPVEELTKSFNLFESAADSSPTITEESQSKEPRKFVLGNRTLSARAAEVTTPKGDNIGSVVVLRDITREAETDELKDAFITSVSHELRTPLAVVKLSSDLIKKSLNGHADDRFSKVSQNLMKGIGELEHHINQLISISEIQAGTLRLTKLDVELTELTEQIYRIWKPKFKSKNMTFSFQVETQFSGINIDVSHLSWAIDNLVENALNYTPENGMVILRVYTRDNFACLDVIDNGIGIASADQPFLFERFFRAHNMENYAARGVGLGLFITKSIVELHDGIVSAKSESGNGSTFTIALPLIMEPANEPV